MNATKLVFYFGSSQLIIALAGLLRIYFISKQSSDGILSAWFFWQTLIGISPLVVGYQVNLGRITSLETGQRLKIKSSKSWFTLAILCLSINSFIFLSGLGSGFLSYVIASLFPFFLTIYAQKLGASALGYLQGQERWREIYVTLTLSSLFSLGLTVLLTQSEQWQLISSEFKSFLLGMAGLSGPLISSLAFIGKCRGLAFQSNMAQINSVKSFRENTALFPPILVSGFDSIIISMIAGPNALIIYGLYSKFLQILLLVPGALTTRILNLTQTTKGMMNPIQVYLILCCLNAPVFVLFLIFDNQLIDLLSDGRVKSSTLNSTLLIVLASIVSFWIITHSRVISNSICRQEMGRVVIKFLIIISFTLTSMFTFFASESGPFIASCFTYIIAIRWSYSIQKRFSK